MWKFEIKTALNWAPSHKPMQYDAQPSLYSEKYKAHNVEKYIYYVLLQAHAPLEFIYSIRGQATSTEKQLVVSFFF